VNELLAALVQLGIIDRATADRINRNLDPAQAQAWAEGRLYDEFAAALDGQRNRLLRIVDAANGRPTQAQINAFWQAEDDAFFANVQRGLYEIAQERAITSIVNTGAFDMWQLVNQSVIDWVDEYYTSIDADIVGSIPNLNATGRTEFARTFLDWQRGELETAGYADGLPQLIRAIEPTFGQVRAERIAVTETTRIFYEATYQAANANPYIVALRWYTAADERVCFPAGTLVATNAGDAPIESIKPGDYVLTRAGYRKVIAASARLYQGAMTTIVTDDGAVTATSDHPFWTLEQGWLQCGNLAVGHTLQSVNDECVNVCRTFNFRIGDAANNPAVGFKKFDLAGISLGVLVPVDAIDFESNAQIGNQEVNGVSPDLRLLDELYVGGFKDRTNNLLNRGFASKRAVAGKTAESSSRCSWLDSEKFSAIVAGDFLWRASAFLRAVMPIQPLFSTKNLAASLAGDVLGGCGTAVTTANGVPIGNGCANGKLVPAHWTRLGDHSRGTGNGTALKTAILAPSVDLLSSERLPALLTNLIGQYSDTIVAGLRAVFFALPSRVEFLSASLANLLHCNSFGDSRLLTQLCHVGCNSAIWVYDIQVDEHPEFYANGVLVHNCPVCGPNHTIAIPKAQRTWPNGASVPAHVNCRCSVIEETELTMQTALPREERYQWSEDAYAQYQADQRSARRQTNLIDTLTGMP